MQGLLRYWTSYFSITANKRIYTQDIPVCP